MQIWSNLFVLHQDCRPPTVARRGQIKRRTLSRTDSLKNSDLHTAGLTFQLPRRYLGNRIKVILSNEYIIGCLSCSGCINTFVVQMYAGSVVLGLYVKRHVLLDAYKMGYTFLCRRHTGE